MSVSFLLRGDDMEIGAAIFFTDYSMAPTVPQVMMCIDDWQLRFEDGSLSCFASHASSGLLL